MATSKQTTKYMKDHNCTKAKAEAHFNKMAPVKKQPLKKFPKLKALPTIDKPRMSDKALIASMSLTELVNAFRSKRAFWKAFATHPNRYAYWEEFVYHVLNAKLPGKTYWLSSRTPGHIIDDKTKEEYGISHLVMGDSTMGMDIFNIYFGRAVSYEAKWVDNGKTLSFDKVANKQYPINKVEKIDKLIYCTNAHQPSREVRKQVGEAGFLLHDEWMSKEAFDLFKTQLNKPADVMKGRLITPRPSEDDYWKKELAKLKKDCTTHFDIVKKITIKIFMHWPASSGKGTFPRLVYDLIFEPLWDFKKSYPTNLVLNPSLIVLEGNLILNIEHDIALGNDNVHVIFASKTEQELATDQSKKQALQSKAMFISNRKDLMKFLKENAHRTIFIHTTFHSYKAGPASVMKALGKKFYWAHIDEVHHAVQAKHQPFSACLYDDYCVIDNRFMTSANIKVNKNELSDAMAMDDADFCDIKLYLKEKEAVEKGWKRKSQILSYLHNHDEYPEDWIEVIQGGCDPYLRVAGTDMVVEHSWFIKAYDLVKFRVEYSNYNHTLCTLNRLERCSEFVKFFKAVYPKLLKEHCGGTQNALYKRLIKAHMFVCRGEGVSAKVNAIPRNYDDSFVFQVQILGEGWSPEDGWIDNTCFIDPKWAPIGIYQIANRGTRPGDGTKKIHYIIMSHFAEDLAQWNVMFDSIKTVLTALELGEEDIKDVVFFQPFKKLPGKKQPPRPPIPNPTPLDEVDMEFFYDEYASYIKEGRYYRYGTIQTDIIETYQKNFEDAHMWWVQNHDDLMRLTFVEKATILKHYEFFAKYRSGDSLTLLKKIISGEDYRVSSETIQKMSKWEDDISIKHNNITTEMQTVVTPNITNEELTNIYTTKFGSPNIDVNNLINNKDKLLSTKKSTFFEELVSSNKHKIQINKTDDWVLEEIK